VEIRAYADAAPFTTKDGSTIRELMHGALQSLAEATLVPGQETERHYHHDSEELYSILEGAGLMEIDGKCREVGPGDTVLIPPGAWHQIRATSAGPLRFLCSCAPAYRHEDTYFA
jgi:mannose-6-phosphate isomerase-like protein (cupin superfamily)